MNPPHIAFATLALYVGLICGATTWVFIFHSPCQDLHINVLFFLVHQGILADIIGRKLSWTVRALNQQFSHSDLPIIICRSPYSLLGYSVSQQVGHPIFPHLALSSHAVALVLVESEQLYLRLLIIALGNLYQY
jgi:hypothetical protein